VLFEALSAAVLDEAAQEIHASFIAPSANHLLNLDSAKQKVSFNLHGVICGNFLWFGESF